MPMRGFSNWVCRWFGHSFRYLDTRSLRTDGRHPVHVLYCIRCTEIRQVFMNITGIWTGGPRFDD